MNNVINCKEIAQKVKNEVKAEVEAMQVQPHLVVVQVGGNQASSTYVRNKERVCEEVGIKSSKIHLGEETTQQELEELVIKLNSNTHVHGILVQLPLPSHLDEQSVINLISPNKDVDGLTPMNTGLLALGSESAIVPCTPLGVMRIFKEQGLDLAGKEAIVVGRSNLFGKPMAQLLLQANATVTIAHSRTQALREKTRFKEVVVCAIGKPKYFNEEFFYANTTIIDVGINRDEETNKLCGDVDFENVMANVDGINITPVPSGVGVMTTAMLMTNVLKCAKKQGLK